jgi:Na+-translocating ferredoxin:NAD+ oxidoreductase RnfG subunit
MKSVAVVGLKLFAICAVAALTLGGINAITEPLIIQRKIMELQQALDELTPDAETAEAVEVADNPVIVKRYPVRKEGQSAGMILQLDDSCGAAHGQHRNPGFGQEGGKPGLYGEVHRHRFSGQPGSGSKGHVSPR